jgi:nucleoside-triphosphatase THEP1
MKTPELILLTGERGCGKTAWCLELIRQARLAGLHPAGLVSPAVFQDGVKTGIDLVDVSNGESQRLAEKRAEADPLSSIGADTLSWQFDADTLAWGNRVLERLRTPELLLLDELGPLEFQFAGGLAAGLECIDDRDYLLACVVVRPELLAAALERWPWGRVIRLPDQLAESRWT